MNTIIKLQKSKHSWNATYMRQKTQDDNTIHQLDHNETVIKSKYDNNGTGYWSRSAIWNT